MLATVLWIVIVGCARAPLTMTLSTDVPPGTSISDPAKIKLMLTNRSDHAITIEPESFLYEHCLRVRIYADENEAFDGMRQPPFQVPEGPAVELAPGESASWPIEDHDWINLAAGDPPNDDYSGVWHLRAEMDVQVIEHGKEGSTFVRSPAYRVRLASPRE